MKDFVLRRLAACLIGVLLAIAVPLAAYGAESVALNVETPAMPANRPKTWLTYHLAHPGPSGASPGDPNPAFYYQGR